MSGLGNEDRVIELDHLTKRFGSVLAVHDLSLRVLPGRVTGFLGPNGAGKTTTLRMLLGLVRPTSGTATIGGLRYDQLPDPTRRVGAALEATGFHAGRTARDHLRVVGATCGIPDTRVDEVLSWMNLTEVARRRVGGFSLGMRQRLALAAALLGNPPVLLLDEPANGLDPEGIAWLRGFLRQLAAEGRTVLVSSHVLSEVQQTVDDVVIISHGRLIKQASLAELEGNAGVLVRTPTSQPLVDALTAAGLKAGPGPERDVLRVAVQDPAEVGAIAFRAGIELHELCREKSDLEDIFLRLTADDAFGQTGPQAVPPDGGTAPAAPAAPVPAPSTTVEVTQ